MKPKAPKFETQDVRTPGERALAESQAQYFQGKMNEPEWGYKTETAAYDPMWQRAQANLEKQTSKAAAERGFGMLQHGPSVSAIGRGTQELSENRVAGEMADKQRYMEWIRSGGRTAATPMGRSTQMTSPGSPSPFSQIAGPVMTGIGYGLGGPIGGAVAGGFGNMIGNASWAGSGGPKAEPSRSPNW